MKVSMYAIKDNYVGFLDPVISKNDNEAIRLFKFGLSQPDTLHYSNRQDYDLYKVGEFDNETGVLTPCTPTILYTGAMVNPKEVLKYEDNL